MGKLYSKTSLMTSFLFFLASKITIFAKFAFIDNNQSKILQFNINFVNKIYITKIFYKYFLKFFRF